MSSNTSINTRVFSPYVVLKQDTSRLAITLKEGEGYTLPSAGLTAGDVIRYDPTNGYTLSQANTEENSEVVGVIESYSGSDFTVVVSGSINYPTDKLSQITSGDVGGVDILFLNESVAGGLTGTIDLSGTGEKIVKPVLQVAPHGNYNAVVLNYIGYKTGNQAATEGQSPFLPPGAVMFASSQTSPGVNWLDASEDLFLSVSQYPDLYNIYANSGNFEEKITVSSGTLSSIFVGKSLYQLSSGVQTAKGTITSVDLSNNLIYVNKASGTSLIDITKPFYIQTTTFPYTASATVTNKFTVPKIITTNNFTQSGSNFVPYIKAYEITSVKVPQSLTITTLNVEGILGVGNITDIETKINAMQAQINTLNSRVFNA